MRKKDRETIEQIRESIDQLKANQKTEELVSKAISNASNPLVSTNFLTKEEISDEDRYKAAYALNLCTVSVSQIVDYNDIYILEQEYETILNNLNLEEMPKDNALLSTLKQILDTVTFFRIQEGDKKFIDLKYQQRVKDALWSAVPNIGLIFAGGNPITLAISLVSQVGMGYMNYRKEKAKISLEYDEGMWKLQRSAIEQFNGLRRELFDTAWRLADRYNFPDNYRLTERQIAQYNTILMDPDDVRRFERLLSIKDKFKAYPPYWYYLANSAKSICENNELSEDICSKYLDIAKNYYKYYLDVDEKYSLLRENAITSTCALEYIQLPDISNDEKQKCIKTAIEKSGNAPDILQLCAISYLSIGDYEKAKGILRSLVNEEYNLIMNAQILSLIYVNNPTDKDSKIAYDLLSKRINRDYLAEFPSKGNKFDEYRFFKRQNRIVLMKYVMVLKQLHDIYKEKFNKILPPVEEADVYFSDKKKKEEYKSHLDKINFSNELLILFNELIDVVNKLNISTSSTNRSIKDCLIKHKECINNCKDSTEHLKGLAKLTFDTFTEEFFKLIIDQAVQKISKLSSIGEISGTETLLSKFCESIPELKDPDYLYEHINDTYVNTNIEPYLKPDLFYDNSQLTEDEIVKGIDSVANTSKSGINCDSVEILTNDDFFYFSNYFDDNNKKELATKLRTKAIAVINDKTKRNRDIIITRDRYYLVVKGKVKREIYKNSAIDLYKDSEKHKEIESLIRSIEEKRKGSISINEDIFNMTIRKLQSISVLYYNTTLSYLLDDSSEYSLPIELPDADEDFWTIKYILEDY